MLAWVTKFMWALLDAPNWSNVINVVLAASLYKLIALVGIALLALGFAGNFRGWFPGFAGLPGRIVAAVAGLVFIAGGVWGDDFRITTAQINSENSVYADGPCPVTVALSITLAANRAGALAYEIRTRDGEISPTEEISIKDEDHLVVIKRPWIVAKSVENASPELIVTPGSTFPARVTRNLTPPVKVTCPSPVQAVSPASTPAYGKGVGREPASVAGKDATGSRVVLPGDFETFAKEEYRDNRPSNPQHGEFSVLTLDPMGEMSLTDGRLEDFGPTFASARTTFPYIQFDKRRGRIVLHPGTYDTSQMAASLGFQTRAPGVYSIAGSFQRANDLSGAGDGVDVALVVDGEVDPPLWQGHINPNDYVKKTFTIKAQLLGGKTVRFLVFSGPEGKDGTFDATSLDTSVSWVPDIHH